MEENPLLTQAPIIPNENSSNNNNQCLDLLLLPLPSVSETSNKFEKVVEIYSFPDDRSAKHQVQIYFNLLNTPDMILYFVNTDSTVK